MEALRHEEAQASERRAVTAFALACPLWLGLAVLAITTSHMWGFDYHGGIWQAGRDILDGRNPYPAAVPRQLLLAGNSFITPPLLALINLPLALLPFAAAVSLWNVVQVGALAAALGICGVRDWRGYALAVGSLPFMMTLATGQPNGLFALAAAVAWRYRNTWRSAASVGLLIAAKLVAWPLILWFVFTRRFRNAALSFAVACAALVGTWTVIGFKGMTAYPKLLAADSRAFGARSDALVSFLARDGMHEHPARMLATAVAVAIGALLAWRSRNSDIGMFAAMIVLGLVLSPILWTHYLVLLLVPLAVAHPKPDHAWLAYVLFWLSPSEPPISQWQIPIIIAVACAIALSCRGPCAESSDGGERQRIWARPGASFAGARAPTA